MEDLQGFVVMINKSVCQRTIFVDRQVLVSTGENFELTTLFTGHQRYTFDGCVHWLVFDEHLFTSFGSSLRLATPGGP